MSPRAAFRGTRSRPHRKGLARVTPHVKLAVRCWLLLAAGVTHAAPQEDLFRAAQIDRPQMAATAAQAGANLNAPDPQGQTALLLALYHDNPRMALWLLDQPGVDIEALNPWGENALMLAALRGQVAVVERLLALGATVNRPEGWTPLHYAASSADPRSAALLLARGARLDAVAPNGNTPLMMAAFAGAIDVADALVVRGANLTLRNAADRTAADLARLAERDALADRLEQAMRRTGR